MAEVCDYLPGLKAKIPEQCGDCTRAKLCAYAVAQAAVAECLDVVAAETQFLAMMGDDCPGEPQLTGQCGTQRQVCQHPRLEELL